MKVKPKYKVGKKVILLIEKNDGYCDIGYITGIKVKRSYGSAGLLQFGGLSLLECMTNGYLKTYIDNCDEVLYEVTYENHTNENVYVKKDVLEEDIVPFNKENKSKYIKGRF